MKSVMAYLSFVFVSIGVVAWARVGGSAQGAMQLPFVHLQSTTPGSAETGNTNVTGTMIAGQLLANGIGAAYGVTGQSDAPTGAGVIGHATGTAGANTGVYALTDSAAGTSITATNSARNRTVQLNGPNGAVWTDGHYYRQYGVGERHAADPIAYGNVASNGFVLGGSGNFTVAHIGTGLYELAIDGDNYNESNTTVVVTLTTVSFIVPCVTQYGTTAHIYMRTQAGYGDNAFNFVVYKTNPSN